MIARLALAVLLGLAAAGSAVALILPAHNGSSGLTPRETIIEKNQYWPVLGPLTVEPCATQSCMEV